MSLVGFNHSNLLGIGTVISTNTPFYITPHLHLQGPLISLLGILVLTCKEIFIFVCDSEVIHDQFCAILWNVEIKEICEY